MARPDNMAHGSEAAAKAARETAHHLLDIGAVNFRPEDPYTFTSGRVSPSYIDCRRVIAFPEAREAMTAHAVDLIDREIGRDDIDVVAGGETAGIPYAAFVAVALGKPMVYVRKEPKGFGRMAQIEGALDAGAKVLLVEDLTTDGGSKVRFVDALRAADAVVAAVDVGALASHYGVKHDAEDPAEKDTCKEMDKRKEALLNALLCRVERFIELLAPAPCCDAADAVGSLSALLPAGVSPLDHLKNLWGSVNQWWVAADQGHEEKARYTCLLSQVRRREGRPGNAGTELLKLLKSNEGPPKKKLLTEFIALCEQMGWMHWSVHYKDVQLKLFPAKLALL